MLLDKIKKILQKEGGKCIVIDEEKQNYLVIELRSYSPDENGKDDKKENISEINKANRDIDEFRASEQKTDEFDDIAEEEKQSEEVKVEDLPF